MVIIDSGLSKASKKSFLKIWDGTVFFNSICSNSRGVAVLLKDGVEISNTNFTNVINGHYSKFEFVFKNEKYLLNCLYSPNEDKEARAIYETVFQDDD